MKYTLVATRGRCFSVKHATPAATTEILKLRSDAKGMVPLPLRDVRRQHPLRNQMESVSTLVKIRPCLQSTRDIPEFMQNKAADWMGRRNEGARRREV